MLQLNTDLAIFGALQSRFDFSIVLLNQLTMNKLPSGPSQRSSGDRGQGIIPPRLIHRGKYLFSQARVVLP